MTTLVMPLSFPITRKLTEGGTPVPQAGPPAGFMRPANNSEEADEGVGRGPGGPPYINI